MNELAITMIWYLDIVNPISATQWNTSQRFVSSWITDHISENIEDLRRKIYIVQIVSIKSLFYRSKYLTLIKKKDNLLQKNVDLIYFFFFFPSLSLNCKSIIFTNQNGTVLKKEAKIEVYSNKEKMGISNLLFCYLK